MKVNADIGNVEIEEFTIEAVQVAMNGGGLSARALAEMYLDRIERLDRAGPSLNAMIEINPHALAIADALDQERTAKGPRSPLHGVPVVLKDNIDTADRMKTTAGSLALAGAAPKQDAFVAQQLREAGAILLGKANLSEWANFRSTRSSSGWSSRGGQTRNPYALDRTPCGSSSGSAVAVAANLCVGAIGTETDGSILCPASINGIVGIKPTVGLWSRSGIVPIAHSQDTAGPMARTVRDAVILLGVMVGMDPADAATEASAGRSYRDYTQFLDREGLQGARIGVARNFFGAHPGVDAIMEVAIDALREAGAVIIDPANIDTATDLRETEFEVLLYEFKADLNAYLAGLGPHALVHSLEEVIVFNEQHWGETMPFFGQEIMLMAQEKGPLSDKAYMDALRTNHRLARDEGIDAVLRTHGLDAIIAPSNRPAWLVDLVNGDPKGIGGSSSPAAVAGYPSITVPAGYVRGLPVGLSFIGGAYAEPTLIKLAFAFEQATQVRRPPRFLSTVDLSG